VAGGGGGEGVAEFAAGAVQAGHDGAEWGVHDGGDVAVGVALDVGEVDGGAEFGGEFAQGGEEGGVGDFVEGFGFGGAGGGGEGVGAGGPVVVGVGAGGDPGFALVFAVGVDEGGGEDAVQPGAQVGAGGVLGEAGVGLGEGVLDEVFGVGGVAGQAQGGGVELGQVGADGPPRAFRTAELVLTHAASCRFRYSLWTSCGVL
jgi:hypothetical protein